MHFVVFIEMNNHFRQIDKSQKINYPRVGLSPCSPVHLAGQVGERGEQGVYVGRTYTEVIPGLTVVRDLLQHQAERLQYVRDLWSQRRSVIGICIQKNKKTEKDMFVSIL